MPAPIAGLDGAWACQECGNVNFSYRQSCNRCQAPKPGEGVQHAPTPQGGPPMAGVDGNWKCPFCGNVNFAIRNSCNRCQAPRPEHLQRMPPAGAQRMAHGQPATTRGGPPIAGVDGNWACTSCGNVNFAVRTQCNRCQTPRQTSEDDFDQLFAQEQLASGLGEFLAPAAPLGISLRPLVDRQQVSPQLQKHGAAGPAGWPTMLRPPQQRPSGPSGPSGNNGAPVAGENGNWACPQCGNVNYAARTVCNRCQGQKPDDAQLAAALVQKQAGGGGVVRKGGAPVAGVDGNWQCPACGNVNYAVRQNCNRCHAPKPVDGAGPGGVDYSQFAELTDESDLSKLLAEHPELFTDDSDLSMLLADHPELSEPAAKRAKH